MTRFEAWARALALIGAIVAVDQLTKQLVISTIERGQPIHLLFGFELTNVRNEGVAFGLLAGGKGVVLLLTLSALTLLLSYFALHATRRGLWVAVGLVAGGALGNLADRLSGGSVVDFLDPPLWPAFNLADVAIVLGVAQLIIVLASPKPSDVGADRA
jgi:signal peptidase II